MANVRFRDVAVIADAKAAVPLTTQLRSYDLTISHGRKSGKADITAIATIVALPS